MKADMNIIEKIISEMPKEKIKFSDLAFCISQELHTFLETHEISQSELAKRLRVSEACVSKMLSMDANLTIETIARILTCLEADMQIKVVDSIDIVMCTDKPKHFNDWKKKMLGSVVTPATQDDNHKQYQFPETSDITIKAFYDKASIAAA